MTLLTVLFVSPKRRYSTYLLIDLESESGLNSWEVFTGYRSVYTDLPLLIKPKKLLERGAVRGMAEAEHLIKQHVGHKLANRFKENEKTD